MKLLYLHQHFTTRQGSTGTRSYEMARAMIAAGHEVHIVCGSFQVACSGLTDEYINGVRQGYVDGIYVTEFEIPYSNSDGFATRVKAFLLYAWRCTKLALTETYDIVFATSTPLTAGIPGIIAKVLRRKTFIFEVRDLWPELPKAMGVITNPVILSLMSALEWVSYRSADACIGLSPGIVQGIKDRSAANKSIALIPNGCDIDLFGDTKPSHESLGEKNEDGKFTAIFSGAHGKANGLDAIINTAKILQTRGREDIRILFVGEGGDKGRLIEKARVDGITNCFFESMIPKTELAHLLKNVDVGLMVLANVPAFYYGTSPNKFFDYIAAGLPVINNYPGWVASIVEEENLGIVVPPQNPELFADAICRLADNRLLKESMGVNARLCAEKRFGRMELAAQFVDFIESVKK